MAKNNASTTLAAGITAGAGTLTVPTDKGQLFQNGPLTVYSGTSLEVMLVTNVSGDTLTVTRGQEGTTALAWSTGATVLQGLTAGLWSGLVAPRFATFKTGATLTKPVHAAWNPTTGLHALPRSFANATYYLNTQPYQPAFGFTPVQKYQLTGRTVLSYVNLSGTNYVQLTYPPTGAQALLWTSALAVASGYNADPNQAFAQAGAVCYVSGGPVEIGEGGQPGAGQVSYTNTSNPWAMTGYRQAGGNANWPIFAPWVSWFRNQQ